tara:strand:+ start:1429 stop:1773 length:345 start_codon:yes stop_codon:yes gene_type:complete
MSRDCQFRSAKDYLSPAWLMLKEQATQRGEGLCEFCGIELSEESHLHHRWYPKQAPDTLRNLMVIHPHCHEAIHFGRSIPACRGSLAFQGDRGKGNGQRWRRYLSSQNETNGVA